MKYGDLSRKDGEVTMVIFQQNNRCRRHQKVIRPYQAMGRDVTSRPLGKSRSNIFKDNQTYSKIIKHRDVAYLCLFAKWIIGHP